MESRGLIPFLVAMMLLTGVCNTLLTKYQVRTSPASPLLIPSLVFHVAPFQCLCLGLTIYPW